ncbi:MAG: helix-turn-helix transcriptional regulator [Verrucomicrobiales bacterium]|nr:helix-turn-helix transcriptional regulator [Verrucomicrobiales bacterium]
MNRSVSKAFGEVVRKRRVDSGLSQEALSEKANLHATYIGLIERGKRNPTIEAAEQIAAAFGVRLSILISEAEKLS